MCYEVTKVGCTYRWIELCATDVGKDGDIDSKRHTESEGDVNEFGDIWRRVLRTPKLLGTSSVERDLCSCEGEEQEHECSDELPQDAANSRRTTLRCGGASEEGADDGSCTGRVGSLLLYFSASFPVMKDIRLCLLRVVMMAWL